MADDDKDRLNRIAEQATDDFLHRSSVTFLECAINLMMTHMHKDDVAAILRAEADMLDDLD